MARVTPLVAITTVMLCGAAGAVLGSVFPLESLKGRPEAPAKAAVLPPAATTIEDIGSTPAPKEPQVSAAVAPPVAAPADDLASEPEPSLPKETPAAEAPAPTVAPGDHAKVTAVPREAPTFHNESETASADPRPEVSADAPSDVQPAQRIEPTDKNGVGPPPAPAKEIRKLAPARSTTNSATKTKTAARDRVKRDEAAREETPAKRSLISQLPFFGPLFGGEAR